MVIGILATGLSPLVVFLSKCGSDVFVIYDDVQYDKEGRRNRNRIKTANGVQWLTVPVLVKFTEHPLVNEVRIDNQTNWRKKHLFSIKQNYSKTRFYGDYIHIFEDAYLEEWDYLVDLDIFFITKLAECLGMNNKRILRLFHP